MSMRIFWKHIIGLSAGALALSACAFERETKYEPDTRNPMDTSRPDVPSADIPPNPDVGYDADGHTCIPIPSDAVANCEACGEGTRCQNAYTYDCGIPYYYCGSIAGSGCWSNEECGPNYTCQGINAMMMPQPAEDAGMEVPAPQGYCVAQEGAACNTHYDCSAGGNHLVCLAGACSPVENLATCESAAGACTSPSGADGYCESICVWPVRGAAPGGADYDAAPPCPSYCIPNEAEEGPVDPTSPEDACRVDADCPTGQACVLGSEEVCTPEGDCTNQPSFYQCQAVDAGG